jgi:peroxiredoxin Q/BCP
VIRETTGKGEELELSKLKSGDKAPNFALKDQNGSTVRLSHFKGKHLLVYFYPKADTPGCTKQSCAVRDSLEEFDDLGVTAVGISPDEPERQKKFDGKYDLGFPLLSDPDHKTAKAYGVWGQKSLYGRKFMGIIRSSFLIDGKGKILNAWYKVSPKDTVPKAMATLEG